MSVVHIIIIRRCFLGKVPSLSFHHDCLGQLRLGGMEESLEVRMELMTTMNIEIYDIL